jgi:hypothetical protein
MNRPLSIALLLLLVVYTGRAADAPMAGLLPAAETHSLCEGDGQTFLSARLRGAIDANIDWRGAQLECEGGPRPGGHGLRAAFAGVLPAAQNDQGGKPRRLRFIFGIAAADKAPDKTQPAPTNLTVILEGEQALYTTRGDERCATEITAREPAPGASKNLERLSVRGYCLTPAEDIGSGQHLLISTFEFTGVIRTGEDP